MEGKKLLIDTNVLVYANNLTAPLCQNARTKLTTLAPDFDSFWISRQTIREYMVVTTNLMKIAGTVNHQILLTDVENFFSLIMWLMKLSK